MPETIEDWLDLGAQDRSDLDYWLMLARLQQSKGLSASVVEDLGGAAQVFRSSAAELSERLGTRPRTLRRLVEVEVRCDLGKEREAFARSGATLVTVLSDQYPAALRDLPDAPACLFALGDVGVLSREAISIVGSRSAPDSALMDAEDLAARIAAHGVSVVSGFAMGVDAAAHRGALREGHTVAVLGCGIDVLYPTAHATLRQEVAERGALVTEQPLGSQPRRWTFPSRNRLIAALGKGTVVVGARESSGALLTAQWAEELGRPVGAVPGDTRDERHRGAIALIEKGANLIGSADDALRMVGLDPRQTKPATPARKPALSPTEQRVYGVLVGDPMPLDDVVTAAGMEMREVSTALMLLEVKGLARRLPGGRFSRLG